MENCLSAMSDAEILAEATLKTAELDHGKSAAVGYFWPDGFKFAGRAEDLAGAEKVEREAIRVRREWLGRSRGS